MQSSQSKNFSFGQAFMRGELSLGFWSFLKKGIGALDSFFILRSLTLYQFGVYQLLLSAYALLSDFFHDLFMEVVGNDLQRLMGEKKEAAAKKLFLEYAVFRMGMSIIPWGVAFFAAPYFSFRFGEEAIFWIRILAFLFLLDGMLRLSLTLLKIRLEFHLLASRPALQKSAQLIFLASFYFFSQLGIKEVLLAQAGGALLAQIILIPALIRSYRPWLEVSPAKGSFFFPSLRDYGKWDFPRTLLSDFNGRVRPWVIKLFLSTEAVGIFGVAYTFVSFLKDLLPMRTLSLLVPRSRQDRNYMRFLFLYGTKYYVLASIFLGVIAAGAVPLAVILLFRQFSASIPLFWGLLPLLPLFAFSKLLTIFLIAERRQKFIFYQMVFQNGLSLVLLFALLPFLGLWGVVLAELVATAVVAAGRYLYLVETKFVPSFPFRSLALFGSKDRVFLGHAWGHIADFIRSLRFHL